MNWRAAEFDVRKRPAESILESLATAKTLLEMLAGVLQTPKWGKASLQKFSKRQNGEKGACRSSANAKMEKMAFAGLLQTSKRRKWPLQDFCKRQKGENGLCRNAANAAKNYLEFAGTLQVLRKTIWSLQECCKCREKLSGACNIVASISKSTLAATALYRKHPIGIRNPIPASNIRSGEVWRAKPSVYPRPTAIFDAVTLLLRSLPCIGIHRQEKRARLG